MELASLFVLVVDVAVQMGLGAEPHGAARVGTLVWAFVVAFVMAVGLLVICICRKIG